MYHTIVDCKGGRRLPKNNVIVVYGGSTGYKIRVKSKSKYSTRRMTRGEWLAVADVINIVINNANTITKGLMK